VREPLYHHAFGVALLDVLKGERMFIKQFVTAVALAAAASLAHAHARLESSQPKAGSELQGAPREIRLQFNEALEPAFSKIELVDAKQAEVKLPKAAIDRANPKVMSAAVPALPPGHYRVLWTAVSHDGHKVKGKFAFRIR
jgi:methionine-rich copper-binding protein CopC